MRFFFALLAAVLLTSSPVESRRHRGTTTSTVTAITTEAVETTSQAAETTTEASEAKTGETKKDKKKKHKGADAEVVDINELVPKAKETAAKVDEGAPTATEEGGSMSMSMGYSSIRHGQSDGMQVLDKAGKSSYPTYFPSYVPTYYPTITAMPMTSIPTFSPTRAKRDKVGGGNGKARKFL